MINFITIYYGKKNVIIINNIIVFNKKEEVDL